MIDNRACLQPRELDSVQGMHIGIIGAGHAGIEAAATARAAGAEVTVFSDEPVLPYFRPRLVAVAMGQAAPDTIAIHPAAWYAERGVCLRLAARIEAFDPAAHSVTAGGVTTRFDALVLACGSKPLRPLFSGMTDAMPLGALWCLADALATLPHIREHGRLVVIGGGILGIECALRAAVCGMRVTMVEKLPRLLPMLLGTEAAGLLQRQVEAKGIALHLGCGVDHLAAAGLGAKVHLDNGVQLEADCVLVCIGARPNLDLARQTGLATGRGVIADTTLQACPGVFVAGDVCQVGDCPTRGTAHEAVLHGRLAGANAVSWLTGQPLQAFVFEASPVGLRYGGVEIWAVGRAGEGTLEQRLEAGARPDAFRAVTRCGERVVGVQMLGTREGFDEWAQAVSMPGRCASASDRDPSRV